MRDLSVLPAPVQDAAIMLDNGEVVWPFFDADDVVALAEAGCVVVGLDLRSDPKRDDCKAALDRIAMELLRASRVEGARSRRAGRSDQSPAQPGG